MREPLITYYLSRNGPCGAQWLWLTLITYHILSLVTPAVSDPHHVNNTVISYPISALMAPKGRPQQGITAVTVRDRIDLLDTPDTVNGAGSG